MNLKLIREELGISQKELAEKLNVSPTNIYNYEKGRTQPSIEWIIKIADALNVTTDYLLGREDDFGNVVINSDSSVVLNKEEQEIFELYRKLDKEQRAFFIQALKGLAIK